MDATRKHEVTVAWVEAVEAVAEVHAVAAFSRRDTATPETVDALRLPVSWLEPDPEPPASPPAAFPSTPTRR